MSISGKKPTWITFDCYGTLIQFDEGLLRVAEKILIDAKLDIEPQRFIEIYDKHEHALEQKRPYKPFREIAASAIKEAMKELRVPANAVDSDVLTNAIPKMPPFNETTAALNGLKRQGFKTCIISNTDDDIVSGNVDQLDGLIDRVITAQQARAYKPSLKLFEHAFSSLGVDIGDVVHVCASPHLDLAAARDLGLRCIWIDRGTGRQPLSDYTPDKTFPSLTPVSGYLADIQWNRNAS